MAEQPPLDADYAHADDLVDAVLGLIALGQLVERAAPPVARGSAPSDCAALDALVGLVALSSTLRDAACDLAARRAPPPPLLRATPRELRR
jgi:hypothetical protein